MLDRAVLGERELGSYTQIKSYGEMVTEHTRALLESLLCTFGVADAGEIYGSVLKIRCYLTSGYAYEIIDDLGLAHVAAIDVAAK